MNEELSRQVKWQREMKAEGKCSLCAKPLAENSNSCCEYHLNIRRTAHRLKAGTPLNAPVRPKRIRKSPIQWDRADWSKTAREIAKELNCDVTSVRYQLKKRACQLNRQAP